MRKLDCTNSDRGASRRPTVFLSILAALSLLISACGDKNPTTALETEDSAADARYNSLLISKSAGDQQTGYAGATLPELLVARVTTRGGVPKGGIELRWEVENQDGDLEVLDAVTRDDGTARAKMTLGRPDQDRVLVRTPKGSGQIFSFTVLEAASVARVTAKPAALTLDALGAESSLVARAYDTDGDPVAGEEMAWSSLDSDVVSVDPEGRVTARANGTARVVVQAACCPVADTSLVTVSQVPAAVTASPDSVHLTVGQMQTASATAFDANGHEIPGAEVAWASASEAVASVSSSGSITARGAGTTTVRATAGDVRADISVRVESAVGNPRQVQDLTVVSTTSTSVTLAWTDVDDGTGQPARYSIRTGSPSLSWGDGADGAVYLQGTEVGAVVEYTWTDLDPSTSYEYQLVSYRREDDGTNTYAPLSNKVAAVTDALEVARVTADRATALLTALGAAVQLSAGAYDAQGAPVEAGFSWSSMDAAVAGVSADGLVTAAGNGQAGIVVSSGGLADTVEVTVDQEPARVTVSPASLALTVDDVEQLAAAVLDANGHVIAGEALSWSSTDSDVVQVDANGRASAVGAGSASVIALGGGLQGASSVEVTEGSSPEEPPVDPGETAPAFEEMWNLASTEALFAQPISRFRFPIWANKGGYLELADTLRDTPWGGTNAVRTHWGGGPYDVHNDEQIGVDVIIPEEARSEEVWIEVYLRYSDNFYVESDHKTMFIIEEDGSRWEMRFGAHRIRAQAKLDNGNLEVAHDASGRELDITDPELVWDGEWHLLRLHLRTGSSGVFESWLDGRKLIDTRFSPGSPSPFATLALGRNGDPVEPSDLYWGPVRVFTQNPGW